MNNLHNWSEISLKSSFACEEFSIWLTEKVAVNLRLRNDGLWYVSIFGARLIEHKSIISAEDSKHLNIEDIQDLALHAATVMLSSNIEELRLLVSENNQALLCARQIIENQKEF